MTMIVSAWRQTSIVLKTTKADDHDCLRMTSDFDSLENVKKTMIVLVKRHWSFQKRGRLPWLSLQANRLDSLEGKKDYDSLWKDNCEDFESSERRERWVLWKIEARTLSPMKDKSEDFESYETCQ